VVSLTDIIENDKENAPHVASELPGIDAAMTTGKPREFVPPE
jgi:hypothetical protein